VLAVLLLLLVLRLRYCPMWGMIARSCLHWRNWCVHVLPLLLLRLRLRLLLLLLLGFRA
jgi:hypothetical protein